MIISEKQISLLIEIAESYKLRLEYLNASADVPVAVTLLRHISDLLGTIKSQKSAELKEVK